MASLWDKCNHDPRAVMTAFRKQENLQFLIDATPTLPADMEKSERFYCWLNEITEVPKCPVCGKPRRWKDQKNGYFATCGDRACKSSQIAKGNSKDNPNRDYKAAAAKGKETYRERTGYDHPMHNPEFVKKFFDDYAETHNGERGGVCSQKAKENREKAFEERGGVRAVLVEGINNKFGSISNMAKENMRKLHESGYFDKEEVVIEPSVQLDELLKNYRNGDINPRSLISTIKNREELIKEVTERTHFLDEYNPEDIVERLYYVVDGSTEIVRCKYCGKKASWNDGRGMSGEKSGYRDTCCSEECLSRKFAELSIGRSIAEPRIQKFIEWQNNVTELNDDIVKENFTLDLFVNYITNPVVVEYFEKRFDDSKSFDETLKRIQLGIEKKPLCAYPGCNVPVSFIGRQRAMFATYCCEAHAANSELVKQHRKESNLEHWGTENVYDSEKYQQMMLDTYGVRFHWQRQDIIDKRNMTCLERYGTIYPSQAKEIMDKIRNTVMEKYGVECIFSLPEVYEKCHSEETVNKIRETNLERYGSISPLHSKEVREKIAATNKERYGEEYIVNLPRVREKAHSPESKEKQRKTNFEKYGYEYPMQSLEIRKKSFETLKENSKMQKSYQEDEVYEYIASLGYEVERHHMTDEFPFNADMYLPKYRLYIEYQGSQFHNRYSFFGTKEDFEIIKTYYEKSNKIKEEKNVDITQYDNMIYVWSDLDVRKRSYAQDNKVRYLEIYPKNNESIKRELEFLLGCFEKKRLIQVPEVDLRNEFEYFKRAYSDELNPSVGRRNLIVKHFQCAEFYKREMEMYANRPVERRRLIQNRCKYLNKKEWELTPNDILTGFKKSGICYGYSHFNPLWTNWFVYKYGIKSVYDPCGGWGHHMLGMLSCHKIIYNEINKKVVKNVQEMKDYFDIDNLIIHHGDARSYIPEDVDAFFMCPPYYNVEKYEHDFESPQDYSDFLDSVFSIWHENRAKIFGLVIREDYIPLIKEKYSESFDIMIEESHFSKENPKKYKEKFYIFKKEDNA